MWEWIVNHRMGQWKRWIGPVKVAIRRKTWNNDSSIRQLHSIWPRHECCLEVNINKPITETVRKNNCFQTRNLHACFFSSVVCTAECEWVSEFWIAKAFLVRVQRWLGGTWATTTEYNRNRTRMRFAALNVHCTIRCWNSVRFCTFGTFGKFAPG